MNDLQDGPGKLYVDAKEIPSGDNNKLIQNVSFSFAQVDYNIAMATFTDAQNNRYSIPDDIVNKPGKNDKMRLDMSGFELVRNPFGFRFRDPRNPDNIMLSTNNQTFIMYDKYIQMDIMLPSRRLYGLGERRREFALGEGTWTMWANGQETPYDPGTAGHQTYGVHPFMLVQSETKGEYMGLYFRNSNAQSPIIVYTGDSEARFSYITTGG